MKYAHTLSSAKNIGLFGGDAGVLSGKSEALGVVQPNPPFA